jgi:2-methylaconitate cis-trans-isomerase PrpF
MPANKSDWESILLAAMGSKYGDQKQIDGVGGATSTTSKVAIVSKSTRQDADVDYTFAQVAVGQGKVDFTGNCGNIASGVGPFALDEGLVHAMHGQNTVGNRHSWDFCTELIGLSLVSGYSIQTPSVFSLTPSK